MLKGKTATLHSQITIRNFKDLPAETLLQFQSQTTRVVEVVKVAITQLFDYFQLQLQGDGMFLSMTPADAVQTDFDDS